MLTKKILAENLKCYRKQNKMSREELSLVCQISTRQLADIENCNCNTTVDTLDKLSEGMGISVSELVKKM